MTVAPRMSCSSAEFIKVRGCGQTRAQHAVQFDPRRPGAHRRSQRSTESNQGMVRVAQLGSFLSASQRPELYSAETFYSRLTRGARTDAVTIWDLRTLREKGEIDYFPTFKGHVQPIDTRTEFATPRAQWSLVSDKEAAAGWRPSVWQVCQPARKVDHLPASKIDQGFGPVNGYEQARSAA